jgi:hypothetical protein
MPCTPAAARVDDARAPVDVAFYLADAAGGAADAWARELASSEGPLREVAACFGRVSLVHANLSKA